MKKLIIPNCLLLGLFILELANIAAGDLLTILPDKEKQTKFVGEAFFVGCESSGKNVQRVMWTGPEGKQITNYLESKQSEKNLRIHVEGGQSGHKGVDLVFDNVAKKDRGTYTCSANVDGKEVQKSFDLNVYKPISFDGTAEKQYLEEGSDSPIRCSVDGDPEPRVSWRYTKQTIRPDKLNPEAKYTPHPEDPNWIVVKNATISDGGNYTCVAIQLTQVTSDLKLFNIDVKVRHRPMEVTKHVNESYSYVNGVVNLTCEVIAEPTANFTWIKDGDIVEPNQSIQMFNEDQRSTLQLTIVDEEMFGDYYCKAENRLGTLERVVTLEKGVKPSVPKTKIKAVKEHEFHLNLLSQAQSDMPITGFKVDYKRPGEDWETADSKEFRHDEPYILRGLKDDTLYVMRVSSKNIAGYSDYSKDIMERTIKAVPINEQLSGAGHLSNCLPLITLLLLLIFSASS